MIHVGSFAWKGNAMANYDASIRVNTDADNSDLLKVKKTFDYIEKSADRAKKSIEGDFNSLSDVVEDYATRLKDLRSKGFGLGDKKYDDLYIAWKNAVNAEKEYIANLDKKTDKGMADEAARVAKEQEKQAEAQRKIEEAAERNLQKENAKLEKQVQLEAKMQAEVAEQERLNSIKNSAVVSDERMVELLQKQKELKAQLADLEKAGLTAGYEQYDNVTQQLHQVNSEIASHKELRQAINEQSEGFERLSNSSKKCFKSMHGDAKKSNGLFSQMASRLKGIALSLLIFNWITKGFNAMVSAMKEGFKNLAQYSDDYNAQMSELKSRLAETKNALAGAFEPVANIVIPYLVQMISWLNIAIDTVGQFLAALTGKVSYTKAKKQAIDYGKALDSAGKSAKNALASFDQLNVINQSSGGVSTVGGEKTGEDAFETIDIENEILESVERIKAIIQPFIDSISSWWSQLDFSPLTESLGKLWTALEPFGEHAYDGLTFLIEEVLEPIGSWVIEEALPEFLDMLSSAVTALDGAIEAAKPGLQYLWDDFLVPIGEWSADSFVESIGMVSGCLDDLAQLFSDRSEDINTILMGITSVLSFVWNNGLKPYYDMMLGAIGELLTYVDNIAGDIIDILVGVVEFISGVFAGDWETAMNGLVKIFEGVVNGFIDIFEGVVNAIIEGLNSISIEIPDFVPEIGGKTFGFDLEKLSLPRLESFPQLANGAVIQGGKPFAAILGDQRFGQTNIETPLKTMVDAFKQALSEMNGNAGGQYTFVAQLDGKELFRETIRQNDIFKKSTGISAFE